MDPAGSVLPEAWTRRWAAHGGCLGAVTRVTKTLRVEVGGAVLQAHRGRAYQTHDRSPQSWTGGGPVLCQPLNPFQEGEPAYEVVLRGCMLAFIDHLLIF